MERAYRRTELLLISGSPTTRPVISVGRVVAASSLCRGREKHYDEQAKGQD